MLVNKNQLWLGRELDCLCRIKSLKVVSKNNSIVRFSKRKAMKITSLT